MRTQWRYVIPGWGRTIEPVDALGNYIEDGLDWFEIRDKLVKLLTASKWYREQTPDSELVRAVAEFNDADDEAELEEILLRIYDIADEQRCWLDPFDMSVN